MNLADIVSELYEVHTDIDELITEAQQTARELTSLEDDLRTQRDKLEELIKEVEGLEVVDA